MWLAAIKKTLSRNTLRLNYSAKGIYGLNIHELSASPPSNSGAILSISFLPLLFPKSPLNHRGARLHAADLSLASHFLALPFI